MPTEQKIKFTSLEIKGDWANGVSDGKKMSCNLTYAGSEIVKEWKPETEYEVTITEKGDRIFFSPKKEKKAFGGGTPRDYTTEKRIAALNNAVSLLVAGKIELTKLIEVRDKFFNYIDKGV